MEMRFNVSEIALMIEHALTSNALPIKIASEARVTEVVIDGSVICAQIEVIDVEPSPSKTTKPKKKARKASTYPKTVKICAQCDEEFVAKHANTRYCSAKCRAEADRERKLGGKKRVGEAPDLEKQ